MSSIFGKQTVAEPPFDVLLQRRQAVDTTYDIRKYGKRFAATCTYTENGDAPFTTLARYIGVFGQPQNEGDEKISMTAPVITATSTSTKIDMTAPVVTENRGDKKVMKFMLPRDYDELSKIPKPLDPSIKIEEIPSQTGAIHRYNGAWDETHNKEMAMDLGLQLQHDGVNITQEYFMSNWQFWGYNPPFTIPYFRRNEVWVTLNEEQVDFLIENYSSEIVDGMTMEVQHLSLFSVNSGFDAWGAGGLLLVGVVAFTLFVKSRRAQRYSRLQE
eukprot:scaffold167415_cov66-Cyclotella_meneghiniana.AAC.1